MRIQSSALFGLTSLKLRTGNTSCRCPHWSLRLRFAKASRQQAGSGPALAPIGIAPTKGGQAGQRIGILAPRKDGTGIGRLGTSVSGHWLIRKGLIRYWVHIISTLADWHIKITRHPSFSKQIRA